MASCTSVQPDYFFSAASIAETTSFEFGSTAGFKPGNDFSIRVDQKLGEVPLNFAAGLRVGFCVRQELIQRSFIGCLSLKSSRTSGT